MQKINLSKILISLTSTFIFTAPAFADGGRDFYIQQAQRRFFNEQQTARTLGMAGSSVATTSNSSSVTGNPAGLGFMSKAEASVTYSHDSYLGIEEQSEDSRIQEDIDGGNGLLAVPLEPIEGGFPQLGTLGLGWSGYNSNVDDSVSNSTQGYVLHAAYAKAIDSRTSLGYRLSYFNDQLDNEQLSYGANDSYKHTIGYQNRADDKFTFGTSVFYGQNSPRVRSGMSNEYLDGYSYGAEIGSAYDYGTTMVATSLDYQECTLNSDSQGADQNGRSYSARIGIEREVREIFVFRFGYRYAANQYFSGNTSDLNGDANFQAASFGAGFNFTKVKIDYGSEYKFTDNGDWMHTVTLSVPFDFCEG